MTDRERTRAAAAESIFGVVMLIGGVFLTTLGGLAGSIGLALIVLGGVGVVHAVFLGLGLAGGLGERKEDPPMSTMSAVARRR
jgi:hypothetical protein